MEKFKAFIWKYKGYVIHFAGIAVVFLDPSVQSWIGAHADKALIVGAVWGFLLHWAQGK